MAFAGSGTIILREGTRRMWSNPRVFQLSRLQQERWVTQTTPSGNYAGATKLNDHNDLKVTPIPVIYHGSMSGTLRGVKLLSASSFFISVVGGPILTFFTNPELSLLMKGALATTMITLSATTTFALHWIASPYVHKLTWVPGSDIIDLKMLSWMAVTTRRKVKLSHVKTPHTQRPLVTFAANDTYYYVDVDNFPNQELLDILVPEKPQAQVANYSDSDDE